MLGLCMSKKFIEQEKAAFVNVFIPFCNVLLILTWAESIEESLPLFCFAVRSGGKFLTVTESKSEKSTRASVELRQHSSQEGQIWSESALHLYSPPGSWDGLRSELRPSDQG